MKIKKIQLSDFKDLYLLWKKSGINPKPKEQEKLFRFMKKTDIQS